MTDENNNAGSGSEGTAQTTPPPGATGGGTTPPTTPSAKMVPESDLIAAKNSLQETIDNLTKEKNELTKTHETTFNEVNQKYLQADAKVKDLEAKVSEGSDTAGELQKARDELTKRDEAIKVANETIITTKKAFIAAAYNVPVDKMEGKTVEQLNSFEEALKIVPGIKGPGRYAVGGVGSGAGTPKTNLDRARETIANTPVVGVRNTPASADETP